MRDARAGLALVLFRFNDLRVRDNPALSAAVATGGSVVPCFVFAKHEERCLGPVGVRGAQEVWIRGALVALDAELGKLGSKLVLRTAESVSAGVKQLVHETAASALFCNRQYEPARAGAHADLRASVAPCPVHEFQAHLLYEPSAVHMPPGWSGGHWGTLIPFLRACEKLGAPRRPLPPPARLRAPPRWPDGCSVDQLGMARMPVCRATGEVIDWAAGIRDAWETSEAAANDRLAAFVHGQLRAYEQERSRADVEVVSRLSPYLRFGQLSASQLYWAVRDLGLPREEVKTFARRLHWRDLAYFQLHTFPHMATAAVRPQYAATEWSEDDGAFRAWCEGRTGYPMVDAGMRELWATGYMVQSVRMVAAAFLCSALGQDWRKGQRWFHDTLVDADVAINAMMWQSASGSGVDPWNFTPSPENASQDPTGAYARRWLPELSRLPTKYLHRPWLAPAPVLGAAGVELGTTYPHRVVTDLPARRRLAVRATLAARRTALHLNDAGGYDLLPLPSGQLTRVFTPKDVRMPAPGCGQAAAGRAHHGSARKRPVSEPGSRGPPSAQSARGARSSARGAAQPQPQGARRRRARDGSGEPPPQQQQRQLRVDEMIAARAPQTAVGA